MQRKKVGLINLQRCNSHGAVLLAYALANVLEKQEYEVNVINYIHAGRNPEKNIIKKILRKIRYIAINKLKLNNFNRKICGISLSKEYSIQRKRYSEFREKMLEITRVVSSIDDPIFKEFDFLIVGSDVVWKPDIANSIDREVYFLKVGGKHCINIAYAASIGTDDQSILTTNKEAYINAFDSLDKISIREHSMIGFVQEYTDKEVYNVIDPVFLLHQDDYIKIENNANVINDDYIYVYIIGDNVSALKEADKLAHMWNCKILLDLSECFDNAKIFTVPTISGISAGPAEFIYNIRNAKYIITDSFHATSFALIFNIPFCVFDRGKISVRMIDLINKFDISDRRYVGSINLNDIDWTRINTQIECERDKGLEYLKEAMSLKKNETAIATGR